MFFFTPLYVACAFVTFIKVLTYLLTSRKISLWTIGIKPTALSRYCK